MGQVRHGSATTTHAVRAAIQRSQASLAQLSQELGIKPRTVAKWRKRTTVEDMKTGPTEPRSTVLSETEEAAVVAFRRHKLLPRDDCLYALQPYRTLDDRIAGVVITFFDVTDSKAARDAGTEARIFAQAMARRSGSRWW